ncbi:MFS transporter [Demequina soli]|uniref:MFS transporter n=1 Tax=Demequina soli TaxID=1638987 RepID=UPI0007864055|nr:MFS transporter [Demequina soli]
MTAAVSAGRPGPPTAAPTPPVRTGAVTAALALAGGLAAAVQTLIVPILGLLPEIFHASPTDTAWAVTVTLVASAVAVPIAGRLGDMYGARRMVLVSLAPLIGGSLLCATASSLEVMVAGRALQGLGMGIVPLGLSLLREVLPADRVGGATAIVGASTGIGGAITVPASAALSQYADWHVTYWGVAALATVAAVLTWHAVPPRRRSRAGEARQRFDTAGATLLTVALLALLLAISQGGRWGWASGQTLLLIGVATTAMLAFVAVELASKHPLVDVRGAARRGPALAHLASLLVGASMYAQSLVIPQVLQLPVETGFGLGQSMLRAGLLLLPGGMVMMLAAPFAARLGRAIGYRVTLMCGAVVIACGYALAALEMDSTAGLMAAVMVCNVGIGLAYAAIPMIIIGFTPPEHTAGANSLNTLVRSIGSSLAAAGIGTLLAELATSAGNPSAHAFTVALVAGGLAALAGSAVAALLPRDAVLG